MIIFSKFQTFKFRKLSLNNKTVKLKLFLTDIESAAHHSVSSLVYVCQKPTCIKFDKNV